MKIEIHLYDVLIWLNIFVWMVIVASVFHESESGGILVLTMALLISHIHGYFRKGIEIRQNKNINDECKQACLEVKE